MKKKDSYIWRIGPILETTKLYVKHGLYKSLIHSLISYPLPVFLGKSTKKVKKEKDKILTKEIKKYLKKNHDLIIEEIVGPFALVGFIEIYLMNLYDLFEITEKDIIYDLGATVGEYSLKCAKKGAKVVAVELEKESYEGLKKNIEKNNFQKQIVALQGRAGSGKGSITINQIAKKTLTLPTLIKMDIEGDEAKALKAGKKILEKTKPRIILETHSKKLEHDCLEILKPLGYKIIKKIDMNAKNKETNLLFLSV